MSVSIYVQHDRNAMWVAADHLQENGFTQQAHFLRDMCLTAINNCCYLYYTYAHFAQSVGLTFLLEMQGKPPVPAHTLIPSLEAGFTKLLQMAEQYGENENWRGLCEQVGRLLCVCRKYPDSQVEARS